MKQLEFVLPAALELNGVFLTDHNRSPISISNERIVNDVRTQSGSLRRYFTADKKSFSVSWSMIPQTSEDTVDAALGAEDLLRLFNSTTGSANLRLYYDWGVEQEYQIVIKDFSVELQKRWLPYRFYDVALEMEEV
jgi:hypothetical protein